MSGRTWSSAVLLSLAVALPLTAAVTPSALADPGSVAQVAPQGSSGDHRADGDHARSAAKGANGKHLAKGKNARTKFNVGGRLTAVNLDAGTLTIKVRGGQVKAVRGTELEVQVADGARIWRNDAAATLADLQVGDKVRAKGNRADGVWTAKRVNAEGPAAVEDGGESTPA